MIQYIECVADRLLNALGVNKIWNSKNPFDWMEMISLQGKTNFFERRVGEYQKAGVMNSKEDKEFRVNVDFWSNKLLNNQIYYFIHNLQSYFDEWPLVHSFVEKTKVYFGEFTFLLLEAFRISSINKINAFQIQQKSYQILQHQIV